MWKIAKGIGCVVGLGAVGYLAGEKAKYPMAGAAVGLAVGIGINYMDSRAAAPAPAATP